MLKIDLRDALIMKVHLLVLLSFIFLFVESAYSSPTLRGSIRSIPLMARAWSRNSGRLFHMMDIIHLREARKQRISELPPYYLALSELQNQISTIGGSFSPAHRAAFENRSEEIKQLKDS